MNCDVSIVRVKEKISVAKLFLQELITMAVFVHEKYHFAVALSWRNTPSLFLVLLTIPAILPSL